MEDIYLLGVDVGTSSIKVMVIDQNAGFVAQESAVYRLINPDQVSIQIDTADMWNAFTGCIGALISRHKVDPARIKAIGISSLCPGLAAFDEKGTVLVDPIIYSDRRSTEEAEIFRQTIGTEKLFAITANSPMAGAMSGTSMLWIKRHLPEVYAKTRYFGHMNTLIAHMLCGNFAIDHSNASYTLLYETAGAGTWSQEICDKIGIDMAKLPPLHKSTDVVGTLTHPVLLAMGLSPQTKIVIGGGDKVAVIGCGNTAIDAARTAIRMGAAEVSVIYHRGIDRMSALRAEYDDAVAEGVRFMWNSSVINIEGGEGNRLRQVTVECDGTRTDMPLDRLILAVGSAPAARIVSSTDGIDVDSHGYVLTRESPYGMTSRRGVFAGGDVTNRPATVVHAMQDAKRVAEGIARYVDAIKLVDSL